MRHRVLFKRIRDPESGIGIRLWVNPKRTTDPGQRIPAPRMRSPLLHSETTSQVTTRDNMHARTSLFAEFMCATFDARGVNLATV